jgi:hypothetical protein
VVAVQHSPLSLVDDDGNNRHLARPTEPFHRSGTSPAGRLLNFPSSANPRNHSHDIRPFLRHDNLPSLLGAVILGAEFMASTVVAHTHCPPATERHTSLFGQLLVEPLRVLVATLPTNEQSLNDTGHASLHLYIALNPQFVKQKTPRLREVFFFKLCPDAFRIGKPTATSALFFILFRSF